MSRDWYYCSECGSKLREYTNVIGTYQELWRECPKKYKLLSKVGNKHDLIFVSRVPREYKFDPQTGEKVK